ncbi:hypothetical protein HR45_11660 [Shewanella mangrovi]|uniref:DUF3466 family protein n=1 Tax=Shewanella mangrovi TaxID=1515746 RepID=A0A094JH09_9GAMM|nr:DUF3466 family protein [Shewanella mangrovi]KFZ37314.1 hypothetical protein HR45_11660 [Shewanella mangrovi]
MKLNSALSLVALSVIGVLHVTPAHAASVYEIVNIEDADLNGTLVGSQNGYGQSINANGVAVGIAKGKSDLTNTDVETQNDYIDNNYGVSPQSTIVHTITTEIVGNNFTFHALENDATTPWLPIFESVNGTTTPSTTDNSVDSYFYDINDAGIRVGATTAPEQTTEYTGSTDGIDNWYYRNYEMRAFVKNGADASELAIAPTYTTYTDEDGISVDLGGWSVAAKINNNNLITGYGSTALSSASESRVDSCISNADTTPIDVCVQSYQFSDSDGVRRIVYQTRAFVWNYANDAVTATQLPLGLDPGESTRIFQAQGLGINDNGVVVGRSHVYRNGNTDDLYYDAAYWQQDTDGNYQYHWIPVIDNNDVRSSKAVDVNDAGIVVGSYTAYINGYSREKFFVYDTNSPDTLPVTPNDFFTYTSELNSYPKDINNQGQVVGSIETSHEQDFDGPQDGFIYDVNTEEFSDINDLLTCSSKGYEQASDGTWTKHTFSVTDSTGADLSYEADIRVVEANKITEDGTIVGTAFVRRPVYQTNSSGNLVLDDDGNPLFELDGTGAPVTGYVPRMVVLKPTNSGSACEIDDSTDEEGTAADGNYQRKGAAFWMWLLMLPLVWYRRR